MDRRLSRKRAASGNNVSGINTGKVLGYVIMPGVIPRARALFGHGFGYFAFLMASIYNMVRLIPAGHPYLNPRNIGKFGVRHVIAEAANNLVISRKNIDQIFIFVALLMAIVILIVQFLLVIYAFIFGVAFAAPPPPVGLFGTPDPLAVPPGGPPANTLDIAFILLDQVFGVPGIFCTVGNRCTGIGVAAPNTMWPFHTALHGLLQFYSMGLLIVGVLIFLYFILTIVFETAVSGTPFGQRFQNVWAPIRLVVALGLLVPINFGLNSGQFIVLYAAKFGSGFATNAWIRFNSVVVNGASGAAIYGATGGGNPSGERSSLIARPQNPDIAPLVEFMSLVKACQYAYWKLGNSSPFASGTGPTVRALPTGYPLIPPAFATVRPYFVKNVHPWMTDTAVMQAVTSTTTYANGLSFYDNSDIVIRFGEYDDTLYKTEKGHVKPWCGEVRIKIGDLKNLNAGIGADRIQEYYFETLFGMWFETSGLDENLAKFSVRFIEVPIDDESEKPPPAANQPWECTAAFQYAQLPGPPGCDNALPTSAAKQDLIDSYQALLNAEITAAWTDYNTNGIDIQMSNNVLNRGWAGAGIWYNLIQQLNGGFLNAILNMPVGETYPYPMQKTLESNRAENATVSGEEMFNPNIAGGKVPSIDGPANGIVIATILNDLYQYWNNDGINQADMDNAPTGRVFLDAIHMLFGTKGLMAMRGDNNDTHPLAQLVAVGKSLVDSAIIAFTTSTISAAVAPIASVLEGKNAVVGPLLEAAATMLSSVATIGLTAGIVLYYILPFLPFLYFYFAVGTWIKSIFEAMVGVPLWALAHLRLDGEGLPGELAGNGYFLIFEIFLRPILSVFGLVAAMVIFAAQVRVLNFIWMLVVDNLTGFQGAAARVGTPVVPRDAIDSFFFTIIYTMVVYMMAIGSFKLIDRIPDNILRFMGAGVSTYSDINEDPTEGLTRYAAFGGLTISEQAVGAVQRGASGIGGAVAQAIK